MPDPEGRPDVLGVIPARGGSKRLHRKNIRLLAGKPMLVWTIEAAQASETLTDFLVSSEDEEILEAARAAGAPVPFVRPAQLATDTVRNIDTTLHALRFMEEQRGKPYDIVVLLQPTAPIRDPQHIDQMVRKLWASDLPTAASVKGPYKKRDPILKAIRDGALVDYTPHGGDPEPFWLYNASLYAARRDYLIAERRLVSPVQVPVPMDDLYSVDVDTELDLAVAAALLEWSGLSGHSD